MRRAGAVAVCVLTVLTICSPRAAADLESGNSDQTSGEAGTDKSGTQYISSSSALNGGKRKGSKSSCSWTYLQTDGGGRANLGDPETRTRYNFYRKSSCKDSAKDGEVVGVPVDAVATVLLPEARQYVIERLHKPEPVIEPLRPQGWVLVQVAMD